MSPQKKVKKRVALYFCFFPSKEATQGGYIWAPLSAVFKSDSGERQIMGLDLQLPVNNILLVQKSTLDLLALNLTQVKFTFSSKNW